MLHRQQGKFGSSPLVRGQRRKEGPLRLQIRIIPARAGPTWFFVFVLFFVSDHPRSCGANRVTPAALPMVVGSSPLVRGQHCRRPSAARSPRIIPARAGPTGAAGLWHDVRSDHPRSCGANCIWCPHWMTIFGSSPLVRGQRASAAPGPTRPRTIPARAGPTNFD